MTIETVIIGGKVSDMCHGTLLNEFGQTVEEHDGYVPYNRAWDGGDYIYLEIDNATGRVLNWKPIKSFRNDSEPESVAFS